MTKQIWRKIKEGGVLDATDLTAEEKKALYAVMERFGLPKATCYSRFFDKGFSPWEIKGVSKIKEEFLLSEVCNTDNDKSGEDGSRGYGYVLELAPDYDDSKFYELVTNLKIGVKLCEVMSSLGMTSQMTVRTRFRSNDWKPWELRGIGAILDEDL